MGRRLSLRRSGPKARLAGVLLALSMALVPVVHADALARSQQEAVALQPRGEWRFDADGIVFDNVAESARLAGVVRTGPGHYRVVVNPETVPINPSPWYSFRIIASRAGSAAMVFGLTSRPTNA